MFDTARNEWTLEGRVLGGFKIFLEVYLSRGNTVNRAEWVRLSVYDETVLKWVFYHDIFKYKVLK